MKRIHFDELDSTISWVKSHYQEFDLDAVTCVTAGVQTAGKGRFSRNWVSKPGNLHMSLFYYLAKGDPRLANLAQIMALALCSLFPLEIKWPNDLIVNRKKIAGILVEIVDCGEKLGVIHSLGMNVNTSVETDQATTSLHECTGKESDLEAMMQLIVSTYFQKLEEGFNPDAYNEKLAFKGEKITCQVGLKSIQGILLGVDSFGKLKLKLDDGTIHSIYSGDLTT